MSPSEANSNNEPVLALPPLREVIDKHGLFTRKALGQHFLLDLNLTRRIARAAGTLQGFTVVEVGPGPGGLTRALLIEGAEHLVAIEKDSRCMEALAPLVAASEGRFTLLEADALKMDVTTLSKGRPIKIVANLPYNVGTPMLIDWLGHGTAIERMTLMFQKEVVERIIAAPDTDDYGRLAVMCQWLCDVRKEFDVAAQAFFPPPKVTSAVVSLSPKKSGVERTLFPVMEHVCMKLFGQRRKMLRSSLKQVTAKPEAILEQCGIDGTLRPENLTVDQFVAIARLCA